MGVGIIQFVFAIPAFFTIDRFGRRNLLPLTFPFLALFQLFSAIAFRTGHVPTGNVPIDNPDKDHTQTHSAHLIIAGLYLFALAYSPGEGPVPFVSSVPDPYLPKCIPF